MEIRTLEALLKEHHFFQELGSQYIQLLVGCASEVRFDRGEYIFHQGEEAGQFYILRHGRVALEIGVGGAEPRVLMTLKEGDVLGWSWLMDPPLWHLDARAVELTRAVALRGDCVRKKCDEDPALGYVLMKRFSQLIVDRLQATRLQLMDFYGPSGARGKG